MQYSDPCSSSMTNNMYEVIFIDDGSTDNSFEVIRDMYHKNRHYKAIRFRRNCGKSAALAVGFAAAQGEYVFTMDADLQDDPNELPALLAKIQEGYDLVSGWKKKRHDPWHKTIPSRFFNFVTSNIDDNNFEISKGKTLQFVQYLLQFVLNQNSGSYSTNNGFYFFRKV